MTLPHQQQRDLPSTPPTEQTAPPPTPAMRPSPRVIIGLVVVGLVVFALLLTKVLIERSTELREKAAEPSRPPVILCSPGETVGCPQLGASWSGGNATCRSDGGGFDVTACSRDPSQAALAEMVKPALRDPAHWIEARCGDGTPFGFDVQLSLPESRDWVIYLQSDSACEDRVFPCSEREPRLTTTPPEADRQLFAPIREGIFRRDQFTNPTFHRAHHVFAYYCSSDVWSGSTTERIANSADPEGWYFSGRATVRALFETLVQRYGLDDQDPATRVLFVGGSAGGVGIGVNADQAVGYLPNAAQRGNLKLMTDAGGFMDFADPDYLLEGVMPLQEFLQGGYEFWRSEVPRSCAESMVAQGQHPGTCFLTKFIYPSLVLTHPQGLGLPLLVQYSSVDEAMLTRHGIDPSRPQDLRALEEWRRTTLVDLRSVLNLFSGGAEPYHMLLIRDGPDGWGKGPTGNTLREVLTRFWEGAAPERVVFGNPKATFVMAHPPPEKICDYPIVYLRGRTSILGPEGGGGVVPLETARSCGTKVIVELEEKISDILHPNGVGIDLTRLFQLWQTFAGQIDEYVADGTVISHRVIENPQDCVLWGGVCPEPSQVDAAGQLSKQLWPHLETIISTTPDYAAGYQWQHTDRINFQYGVHRGPVNEFIARGVSVLNDGWARSLSWSLSVVGGGCDPSASCPMSPDQVRSFSEDMCLTGTGGYMGFHRYEDWLLDDEMLHAITELRAVCERTP